MYVDKLNMNTPYGKEAPQILRLANRDKSIEPIYIVIPLWDVPNRSIVPFSRQYQCIESDHSKLVFINTCESQIELFNFWDVVSINTLFHIKIFCGATITQRTSNSTRILI